MRGQMKFGINVPTRLLFGAGELNQLKEVELPGKFALLVVDDGKQARATRLIERVEALLGEAGVGDVKCSVSQLAPELPDVQSGALWLNHGCDFVIALGSQLAIDKAKAVAATGLPLVTIPTSIAPSTTGVHPVLSIVDPDLLMGVPAKVLAPDGFEAFCIAAEGYISRAHSPISDLYALEAVRLLYKYLPVAIADANNHWARVKLAWAAQLAGMVAATSSLTGAHALADAACGRCAGMARGAALAAVAPLYCKALKNDVMKRFMKMAEKMTQQKAARPGDFLDALDVMRRECRVLGATLGELGVRAEDINDLVETAVTASELCLDNDPRFLNREELYDIYVNSL